MKKFGALFIEVGKGKMSATSACLEMLRIKDAFLVNGTITEFNLKAGREMMRNRKNVDFQKGFKKCARSLFSKRWKKTLEQYYKAGVK